jgi:hypothetical protein
MGQQGGEQQQAHQGRHRQYQHQGFNFRDARIEYALTVARMQAAYEYSGKLKKSLRKQQKSCKSFQF